MVGVPVEGTQETVTEGRQSVWHLIGQSRQRRPTEPKRILREESVNQPTAQHIQTFYLLS